MKRNALLLTIVTFIFLQSNAQWYYDFGTGTGVRASGESFTFLPQPGGGSDYVRVGAGAGSISMVNPGLALGSETELSGVASTGPSANKMSIFDYDPSKTFSTRFAVQFDGGASGEWMYFQGDGSIFNSGAVLDDAQIFLGLRFTYGAAGSITIASRNNLLSWVDLASQPISQGNIYIIDIVGNNSNLQEAYVYGGPQTVDPNTFDLYVNGVLVGDNVAKASLGDNTNIDSFMFYGVNSTGNIAVITIDNLRYANFIAESILPVKFTDIKGTEKNNGVQIDWTTLNEVNVDHYEIQRSADGSNFVSLGNVFAANSERAQYSYFDASPLTGSSYYRVRSFDRDHKSLVSPIIKVGGGKQMGSLTLFPNPVKDHRISLQLASLQKGNYEMKLFNSIGQQVYTQRIIHQGGNLNLGVQLPSVLKKGMYTVQLVSPEFSVSKGLIME